VLRLYRASSAQQRKATKVGQKGDFPLCANVLKANIAKLAFSQDHTYIWVERNDDDS
jgi:hypothetical protein